MGVPDFLLFFKPRLELAADGKEHSVREAREVIGSSMNLSEADLSELLPLVVLEQNSIIAWRGQRAILFRQRSSSPLGEDIFESLIAAASCWSNGTPGLISGSWTNTLNLLNSIPRVVTATAKILTKSLEHRPKHQKRPYKKHIKTFEMNCARNC